MKKTKLIIALPIFALAACSGAGQRIDASTAYARATEIDNSSALYYVRNVKGSMTESMSNSSASMSYSLEVSLNQMGDVYYKRAQKRSSIGISYTVSEECYYVHNVGGYRTVTWFKRTEGTQTLIRAYINDNYDETFSDYANYSLLDDPLEYVEDYYVPARVAMTEYAEEFGNVNCSYYSKGSGNLTVKMSLASKGSGFGIGNSNNNNYNEYGEDYDYTYKSFNATMSYNNYLMTEISGEGVSYSNIKRKSVLKASYPQSLNISLPNGWQKYLYY